MRAISFIRAGVFTVAAVLLAGCGGDDSAERTSTPTIVAAVSTAGPPEDADPDASEPHPQPPDLPGVPENAEGRSFRLERVVQGLTEPVYVTAAPGEANRLYVVERVGLILVAEDGAVRRQPFLDIRRRVRTEVEEGFHSLAFHPEYEENGRLFVAFNDRRGDLRVVEYHAEGGQVDAGSARDLLAVDKTEGVQWHNGGQLQFGSDGLLYVSTGDSARNQFDSLPDPVDTPDPDNNAQNLQLLFGKLLRLDVDEAAPAPELAAYGLRNPWRFSFDRETGDLYIGDVGQFEREEVDYVPASVLDSLPNFGWSVFEGDLVFHEEHELRAAGSLVWPIVAYEHPPDALYCTNIRGTVTGGYVYRGQAVPALRGRYVFGDWCSGEIWTLRVRDGRAADIRKEAPNVPGLVSFGEDAAGELYVVGMTEGAIYRLTP